MRSPVPSPANFIFGVPHSHELGPASQQLVPPLSSQISRLAHPRHEVRYLHHPKLHDAVLLDYSSRRFFKHLRLHLNCFSSTWCQPAPHLRATNCLQCCIQKVQKPFLRQKSSRTFLVSIYNNYQNSISQHWQHQTTISHPYKQANSTQSERHRIFPEGTLSLSETWFPFEV